ncbi:MAG: SPOR domain-containing protein [Lentimicrobiaceae bacterium]|nr:SPOR domain-containing protein [Lentimicrobiaceae bacterium]
MLKQAILFSFLFLPFTFCYTQNNVVYNIENGIDFVEQQYVDAWKKIKKIDGFRIQITSFSGVNSRTSIENMAEQFKQQFSTIPFYITYFEPNFRLRVGNFRTKLDAYKMLQKISLSFPGAFVLKDQIDFKNQ